MCNFLSAIVMKTGDVLWSPYTDSHEDIVTINQLNDKRLGNFCRVEFIPTDNDFCSPDTYVLKLVSNTRPEWFDDDMLYRVEQKLIGIVDRMIVSGKYKLLIGGAYILADDACIEVVKNCRIIAMVDAHVGEATEGARIIMLDSKSSVDLLSSNALIYQSAGFVNNMQDNSRIEVAEPTAHVLCMDDRASIGALSGHVDEMRNSSRIDSMYGVSKVDSMRDSANIGSMDVESCVGYMQDNTCVYRMNGRSKIGKRTGNASAESISSIGIK